MALMRPLHLVPNPDVRRPEEKCLKRRFLKCFSFVVYFRAFVRLVHCFSGLQLCQNSMGCGDWLHSSCSDTIEEKTMYSGGSHLRTVPRKVFQDILDWLDGGLDGL